MYEYTLRYSDKEQQHILLFLRNYWKVVRVTCHNILLLGLVNNSKSYIKRISDKDNNKRLYSFPFIEKTPASLIWHLNYELLIILHTNGFLMFFSIAKTMTLRPRAGFSSFASNLKLWPESYLNSRVSHGQFWFHHSYMNFMNNSRTNSTYIYISWNVNNYCYLLQIVK